MTDHDKAILDAEWFVVENDLIGGWAVATVDYPMSAIITNRPGVYVVGEMLTLAVAEHIAELHNRR